MLTLYFSPGACSMASHIGLEETGAAYVEKPTLLPKGEKDVWFTGAFAGYERLFAVEKELKKDGSLSKEDHQNLAALRYAHRCNSLARPASESYGRPRAMSSAPRFA